MFGLLFLVYVMILYKNYLWYFSSEDVFEKINFGLSGSAGAFRPDMKPHTMALSFCPILLLLLYSAGLFSVDALGERVSSLCG